MITRFFTKAYILAFSPLSSLGTLASGPKGMCHAGFSVNFPDACDDRSHLHVSSVDMWLTMYHLTLLIFYGFNVDGSWSFHMQW